MASVSLTLSFDCVGDDVRLSADSSAGQRIDPRALGVDRSVLDAFAGAVKKSALHGQPLPNAAVAQGQTIQQAVLAGSVGKVFVGLGQEAARQPLLLRLSLPRELHSIPWEALCNPGESLGFWGTSPKVLPVRTVSTIEPWRPREVRGAVKVLAIAPTGSTGLANLRNALEERIKTGEVEWLDPVEGAAAKVPVIFDRLRREPVPHVLHFLGHGGIDAKGRPCLRMGDDDDEEKWLAAEILAQQLATSFQGTLRLIVLEACEGAQASTSELTSNAFSSSAQVLAGAGADAVLAYQWPVKADVARTCSTQFYRALTGAEQGMGDVAFALNEARRAVLATYDGSGAALNPVLYARGPDGQVFQFKGRKVEPPKPNVALSAEAGQVPSGLARILRGKFSLVLGDMWKEDRKAFDKFRDKLLQELTKVSAPPQGLPIGTLAQWFALHRGADKLGAEFQRAFKVSMQGPPLISMVARLLPPGVHTTLLRNSWLEQSLAEVHPNRTIYVIQPQDGGVLVLHREAGADDWEEHDKAPADVDLDEVYVILRPCRGYTPDDVLTTPLLTEDDYHLRLPGLLDSKVMPVDLGNTVRAILPSRPALMLGLSMLTVHHRLLLHILHGRGLPPASLAVVDREDRETMLWRSGAGLPGKNEGVEVLESSTIEIQAALEAMLDEVGR